MSGLIGAGLVTTAGVAQVGGAVAAAGNLASIGAAATSGYLSPAMLSGLGPWAATLRTASWRGIPFAVRANRIQRGRRTAVHQYPYRDAVWVEDLGRGMRSVTFDAFLIGDDVYAQRDAFSAACDVPGPGTLVHPSLGTLQVSNVQFSAGESAERGRVVELELTFVECGADRPLYPTTIVSTQAQTTAQAAQTDLAAASDFLADTATAAAMGADVIAPGVLVAAAWGRLANTAMADAGVIASVTLGLPSTDPTVSPGRYAAGKQATPQPVGTTASGAIQALTTARAATAAAVSGLSTAGATTLPTAAQAVAAAVLAATPEPADQVRTLSTMGAFTTTATTSTAPIGASIATMQASTAALCRCAALAALARSTAAYQPTSYDDAAALLDAVTALLDAEIVSAADAGDTASYLALRALRTAVAEDLTTRGSALPHLVTVARNVPLPSLLLAWELYADASRSDDLIGRANPISPLFMPVKFQALAS